MDKERRSLTDGRYALRLEVRTRLSSAGIHVEERRIAGLSAKDDRLDLVELAGGGSVPLEVLFAHPAQRQVELVHSLSLTFDPLGFVQVDEMHSETSKPGIYAGGDLVTRAQGAIIAAGSRMFAAAMLNHALTTQLALGAALD